MRTALLGVFLTAVVGSAQPPDPQPKPAPASPPAVRFPVGPAPAPVVPPPAPPATDPAAPLRVTRGQFYVIASAKPLLVLPSGDGEVSVAARRPPFMLPAAQAPGWPADKGDPDFVTWGAEWPHLYVVRPVKDGEVSLLVFPAVCEVDKDGKQIPLTAADATRKSLVVGDASPVPPPKPVDPVVPNPAKGFRVLMVYEKEAALSREELNVANSSKVAAYLNAKCAKDAAGRPEWRKWDKSTIDRPGGLDRESAVWRQLWADARPKLGALPQVVIVTDQAGAAFQWPATEDGMLDLLRQYGGN